MLTRILLFLFSNILVNTILKSCHIPLQSRTHTKQFLSVSNTEEALWQKIYNRFWCYSNSARFVEAAFRKRLLYLFWKMGWTIRPLHIIWGKVYFEKELYFFAASVFLEFVWFYSQFLWNAFCIFHSLLNSIQIEIEKNYCIT